jgi:A/G-specific adenine glycosylase
LRDKVKHSDLALTLLSWYDAHARDLPWRTSPADRKTGILPDPYRVWMSEIMLQQTTVAAVKSYFLRFTDLWPTIQDLANAPDEQVMGEWAGLGYYARARNLLKCARTITNEMNGVFPRDSKSLLSLPGIGPYTAAAVGSIAFDIHETVVDGNVERVMSRLHNIDIPLPTSKPELTRLASLTTPQDRAGDYAQAIMDLGATICTPKSPKCEVCPWIAPCAAYAAGTAATLPRKVPKAPKPTRTGTAYIARTKSGAWILERRPEKGLLGSMLGWPGDEWSEAGKETAPFDIPKDGQWEVVGAIRHTFTHFHLDLKVAISRQAISVPEAYLALNANEFRASDLPTVMRKAFSLANAHIKDQAP